MKQFVALFLCVCSLVACGGRLKTEDDIYKEYDFNPNLTAEQKAIADELVKADKVMTDCLAKSLGKVVGGDETVCKTEVDNCMQVSQKACFAGVLPTDCKEDYQE